MDSSAAPPRPPGARPDGAERAGARPGPGGNPGRGREGGREGRVVPSCPSCLGDGGLGMSLALLLPRLLQAALGAGGDPRRGSGVHSGREAGLSREWNNGVSRSPKRFPYLRRHPFYCYCFQWMDKRFSLPQQSLVFCCFALLFLAAGNLNSAMTIIPWSFLIWTVITLTALLSQSNVLAAHKEMALTYLTARALLSHTVI